MKQAIQKYGRTSFRKTVLHVFETQAEAYSKEREIVDAEFLAREDVYNMVGGGSVSPDWDDERKARYAQKVTGRRGRKLTEEHKRKIGLASKGRNHSDETRRTISEKNKGRTSVWKGKSLPEEIRMKQSQSAFAIPKVECPHCKKMVSPQNAKRWHFNSCKLAHS